MNSVQSEDFQFHILKELKRLTVEVAELKLALSEKGEKAIDIRNSNQLSLEIRITNILKEMQVPAHVKGYRFLRDAIKLAYQDETEYSSVTKSLYPTVAKMHNTTASRAERAIRHAIEISHFKGSFGSRKPTNSEVIFNLVDRLKLEDGE